MSEVKNHETYVSDIMDLMDYEIFSPAVDWVFKLLFGDERNKSMLIDLLGSFLELPSEEYELEFLDTHLKKEAAEEKLGIIDVKIRTKSGKIIDIEIQVNPVEEIGKRLSFYKSKLIVGQIREGEEYDVIQRVICVCITDYKIFSWRKEYLNKFVFCNPETGLIFDEIPEEVYTLELPKVPQQSDGKKIWSWLQFLRSRKKEEFEMVAEMNPEIRKAVEKLQMMGNTEEARAEYEWRLKCIRDHNSQINGAYRGGHREGKAEGQREGEEMKARESARNALAEGLSVDTVQRITGLDPETIMEIQANLATDSKAQT
jgi:predicted transposase/invertase (TIGR01784 family)